MPKRHRAKVFMGDWVAYAFCPDCKWVGKNRQSWYTPIRDMDKIAGITQELDREAHRHEIRRNFIFILADAAQEIIAKYKLKVR